MSVHPLEPDTHRRLGEPLPHQQANRPRAHPQVIAFKKRPPFTALPKDSVVLSGISTAFAMLSRSRGQIAHVLLTRSPLYSPSEEDFLVRLACVRHAASVRSEPGSNSPCEKFEPQSNLGFTSCFLQRTPANQLARLFSFQRAISQEQCLRTRGL